MHAARAVSVLRRQRGFMRWAGYAVLVLVLLALAGRFAYWVATEESFGLLAGVLWAIALAAAYFAAAGDLYIARMPAGFLVFTGVSLVALPLAWLAQSRVALLALLGAQLAFSLACGGALSRRLRSGVLSRYPEGGEPAWLRQDHDIVADVGSWALLCLGALAFLWIAPLLLLLLASAVVDLSWPEIRLACAAWGVAATAWFSFLLGGAWWLWLPVAAWIYLLVTGGMLAADILAGPFAAGTGLRVAYIVMPGALAAAFVEVFVLGGGGPKGPGRKSREEGA